MAAAAVDQQESQTYPAAHSAHPVPADQAEVEPEQQLEMALTGQQTGVAAAEHRVPQLRPCQETVVPAS